MQEYPREQAIVNPPRADENLGKNNFRPLFPVKELAMSKAAQSLLARMSA
jgi:hypothetical protein